ncbi:MAG: HAMP domain-containing protein [Endomicrobiales bacterium]|nr:HAMP domain-containing protein [Endomicrobiales bacterium]
MTIKRRLFFAFAVLLALVVVMGAALIYFGLQNWKLSGNRVLHYTRLFFWSEVSQAYDMQWRSLNYFVILNDENEKARFNEQFEMISKRVEAVSPKWPQLDIWFVEYKNFNDFVNASLERSSRGEFFKLFTGELTARSNKLREELSKHIDYHSGESRKLEKSVSDLNTYGIVLSAAVGLFTVIAGTLMSFFIYRSISVPLNDLQKGAKIIGDGNMNHRIDIRTNDEIGRVAEGFNHMVDGIKAMQLQIMQMDRMSSIGRLAGGVAHEINNPLTGVLGQAQLLLEKLPAEDVCRKNVERIESAAQRCRRIVRALLDFARDKNYNFTPRDIGELIDETLDFTKTDMNLNNIRIIKNIPVKLPQIKVSAGHIQQVFLNIIGNAVQAMGKEGTLTIGAAVSGNVMEVSFTDTGKGIKKENLSHVFDPFFTTKDVGQGTGLGLTISYGIVQKHEGEIVARSEGEGRGATFAVRLPLG